MDAKTKREARQILQKLMRDLEDGTHVEPCSLTYAQYLDSYVEEHLRHHTCPRALESLSYMIARRVIPSLGSIPLTKLRPMDLQQFCSEMRGAGLADASVRKLHNTIRVSLAHAVRLQILAVNPADAVIAPRVPRTEMKALSEDETAAMLHAAEGTVLYVPLLLAVGSGMRRGELLGLLWSDIDLYAGTATVQRTLQEAGGELIVSAPKTVKSRRTVTLPTIVVDVLRQHRAEQARRTLAHEASWTDSDYVLAAPHGGPWRPANFDKTWRAFRKRQGIVIKFHGLRHSHATQLLKAGVNVKVISERLGHASIAITLDVYGHVMPSMQEEAAEKIDAGLRAALG
jgi:integrase